MKTFIIFQKHFSTRHFHVNAFKWTIASLSSLHFIVLNSGWPGYQWLTTVVTWSFLLVFVVLVCCWVLKVLIIQNLHGIENHSWIRLKIELTTMITLPPLYIVLALELRFSMNTWFEGSIWCDSHLQSNWTNKKIPTIISSEQMEMQWLFICAD